MINDFNIGTIVNRGVSAASLIVDDSGIIVSYNDKLASLVDGLESGRLFSDKLSIKDSQLFERMILKAKESNSSIKDTLSIKVREEERDFEIFITPFLGEDDNLFFVSFTKSKSIEIVEGENKVTLLTNKIEEIVKSEHLLSIIEKIKGEYPFTIIGKTKIKKLLNELNNSFWLKEPNGKFVIVNDKFAASIGLQSFRIEGKDSRDILPKHLANFISEIDGYISSTLNSVVLDGALSNLFDNSGRNEAVEIPIYDIEEKIVAIIGFTQKKEKTTSDNSKEKFADRFLEEFIDPVIIFNTDLICRGMNKKAVKLFSVNSFDLDNNLSLNDLFTDDFIGKIEFFLQADSGANELESDFILNDEHFDVLVKKIFNEESKFSGVYFLFRKKDVENFEKLLRGSMHDIIMQNSPEAMFIYNVENLKFLEVNSAALSLYGYSREDFLMMDLTDLYAPEDIQTLIESANKSKVDTKFTGPWRHKSKSGETLFVEISKSEIEYKNVKAHLNIVRDVSERIEQDKKYQFFKASFDNSDDLIINTDNDGFITFVNSSVTKNLGHSKKDLENRPFLSLLSNSDRALVNTEIFHSGIIDTQTLNVSLKKLSGEEIKGTITSTPILDFSNDIDSFNLIIKLIEEEKEAEHKEIKSVSKGIDSTFLSNLFHEILTPINVILGFSQEINESLDHPTEEQKEAAEIIQENKKMLLQIMDNAIEYATIEQSKIKLKSERILFVDLLDQIQTNIKKSAQANGTELAYGKISSSLTFDTDKQRFISVISLLLDFTIRIMVEDKIYLSAYQYDSDSFIVSVKDSRTGISSKLYTNLLALFTKDEDLLKKEFGISRFMIRLARKLVEILGAEVIPVEKDGEPNEFGILFPNILIIKEIEEEQVKTESPSVQPAAAKYELAQPEPEPAIKKEEPVPEPVRQPAPQSVPPQTPPPEPVKVEEAPKLVEPAPQPAPEPAAETKTESAGDSKISISKTLTDLNCLYVEDQVDSQILFKVQMKDFKSIDFANSFEKALPLVKSKNYDFIVMDINLQGEYNGLDALRIIQKLPGYKDVPVIAVTAYVLPGDREKFIAAGFHDFISKPVLRDKLMDCLSNIFKMV